MLNASIPPFSLSNGRGNSPPKRGASCGPASRIAPPRRAQRLGRTLFAVGRTARFRNAGGVQPDLAAPHRSENLKALILFEDEQLLVVNKPAGLNTHAPSPFAGEGIYDWLRHREPRWASRAIIHRLDQETSGVLVFAKTRLANQSLTEQFTRHSVRKKYVLLTDRKPKRDRFTAVSALARVGGKYVCRPLHAGGE